jgi:DNA segregation ATPase FtsK/SpoIIIE, S-DNA-T family
MARPSSPTTGRPSRAGGKGASPAGGRGKGRGGAPAKAPAKGRAKAPAKGRATARSSSSSGRRDGGAGEGDQLRDIWGVALLVLAALAALGLYLDAAGVVGVYLALLFRGLFGVFGLLAPPALVACGVILLGERRPANARVVLGAAVTACGAAGLWHIAAGAPGFDAGNPALHASSGWLGAGLVGPLRAVAAIPGAIVLLVAMMALGLLVTTATPPRTVARWIGERFARLRDALADRRERRAERRAAREDLEDDDDTLALDEAEEAHASLEVGGDDDPAEADTRRVGDDDATTAPDDDVAARPGPIYEGLVDDGADDDEPTEDVSDTLLLPRGLDVVGDDDEVPAVAQATRLLPLDERWADYALPPLALLRNGRAAAGNKKTLDQMTQALERTLHQFGVDAVVAKVSRGPTVTRFELSLGEGVRVGAVTKLGDDISYALATAEIRIVAPIPGKSAIGVEVPNRERDLITLGDVLRSPEAAAAHHPLTAGIGVDIGGNSVLVNLAAMPHLLIAGATGSGKSVTMNGIVTSVLMRATPAQVRMILVDPKRVELNHYEGAPHLLTPVVTDPKRATEALAWTVKEMEDRYERLALLGYRNIDSYNAAVRDGSVRQATAISGASDTEWQELPYILFVIDELADLMMVAPRDVEGHIVRIAQMARAVGIHLIIATQRPSVDVVTGLIKANVPSRIALAMATGHDSKTILDQHGAEKLVGDGDLLFLPANASKPHRIQGCYLSESEIEQIIAHCSSQRHADAEPGDHYEAGIIRQGSEATLADVQGDDASDEQLLRAATELVVRSGLGSTSMLQRKLKVGFARAGRLMDELETAGIVGPSEGPKARTVLMSVEELEERLGP